MPPKEAVPERHALKKSALASTSPVPSDNEVVDLTPSPRRVMRKRKQLSYVELDEEDFDVDIGEVPKKRIKVIAKSKITTVTRKTATTLGEAKTKEKMRGSGTLQPKFKVNPVATPRGKAIPKKKSRVAEDVLKYDKKGNEIRKRDYAEEPSNKFLSNKARALTEPLHFINRERCDIEEALRETFTIAGSSFNNFEIRHVSTCTCMDFTYRRTSCKHIIYTMVKVLKSIFNHAPAAPHVEVSGDGTDPNRKPIEGDCPICFMEFEEENEKIAYCKAHCGNNVHESCMDTWLRSQRQSFGKGTCPYCRMDWVG